MIDETFDISVNEQVSVCLRTVSSENYLLINEIFMGFYETSRTDSESLFKLVIDVLSRFDLSVQNCRGQCYDGASNVSGTMNGLQAKIKQEEPRALFVHCAAHRLNLVVQDSWQNISIIRDFLVQSRDLISFIRSSPKRLACFNDLQSGGSYGDEDLSGKAHSSLRPFCPTRWCLRVKSIRYLEDNYKTLLQFLHEISKDVKGEAGAKANGFLKTLMKFENFFLLKLIITVFIRVEAVNALFQKSSLNFGDVQCQINLLRNFLQEQREEGFENLWSETVQKASALDIEEPIMERRKKIPKRLDSNSSTAYFHESPKEKFKHIFTEKIDHAMSGLMTRFNTDTMQHMTEMEKFAIGEGNVENVIKFYYSDFDAQRLLLHRDMFLDLAKQKNVELKCLNDILQFIQNSKNAEDAVIMKVCTEFIKFFKCLLTVPMSTCTAERSFSALRRLKTYIRSTMRQDRLNNLAMLHVHREETDSLDIDEIADQFINRSTVRRNTFAVYNNNKQ